MEVDHDINHSCEDGASTSEAVNTSKETNTQNLPVCLIVLGMAGAGKTTFVQV